MLSVDISEQLLRPNERPFVLVDVGCSGGVEDIWTTRLANLQVFGFDPLAAEIQRLQEHALQNEVYECAFVVGEDPPPDDSLPALLFGRTSAYSAQRQIEKNGSSYIQEHFNSGEVPAYTTREITLDSYFAQQPEDMTPNFLKIDTDGSDYYVLEGAQKLLSNASLLGVTIECQFHGDPLLARGNTFSNIDHLLRKKGFVLYRLQPWEYSRAALPFPFQFRIAGQTTGGTVQWADATYLRDPWASPEFKAFLLDGETNVRHYLALLIILGFPDVAADAIRSGFSETLTEPQNSEMLDALAYRLSGQRFTYAQYLDRFNEDFKAFFPKSIDAYAQPLSRMGLRQRLTNLLWLWKS